MSVQNVQSVNAATGTTTTGKKSSIMASKDDFLKILMSQIKYQDPLEPMKPDQFLSQLSQLTQVEQLQNIAASLDAMKTATDKGNITQWVNTIGKKVNTDGNVLSKGDEVYLTPNGTYDEVVVTTKSLTDGSMKEVRIPKGQPLVYRHEGDENVQIVAMALKGNRSVDCKASLYRMVRGVEIGDAGPVVVTGDGQKYAVSTIQQIKD